MDNSGIKFLAGVMYVVAVVLIGFGFYTMFTYGDGSTYRDGDLAGHIVGGDAYNYIIIALRGVGFMVTGLTAAVCGAAASICASLAGGFAVTVETKPANKTA